MPVFIGQAIGLPPRRCRWDGPARFGSDVRFGSNADIRHGRRGVRLVPQADLGIVPCPVLEIAERVHVIPSRRAAAGFRAEPCSAAEGEQWQSRQQV